MKILSIILALIGMGVMPYSEPVHHVFTMDYEREICRQAHDYHGILSSHWPIQGEAYFELYGQHCRLFTTIKNKKEWEAYRKAQVKAGKPVEKYTEWEVVL